jgi:hypothetical protein
VTCRTEDAVETWRLGTWVATGADVAAGRAGFTGRGNAAGAPIWGNRGSGVERVGIATAGGGRSIPALIDATTIER